MSDIKTGLMFSPLTERVYWGKMNIKTGVSIGNNKKDITSDFIGTMLQKFPINTRQNIASNGKTECVVIVLDEEKAKEYTNAKEENAQLNATLKKLQTELGEQDFKIMSLKADKAELLNWIEESAKSNELNMPLHNTLCDLIQKHKGEING